MSQIPTTAPATSRPCRPGNNRAMVRYRCAPATIGRLFVGEDHEFQHAWVVNLSQQGLGFLLARPVPSGLAILIQLRSTEDRTVHELPAQVVHCTEQRDGDWFVGCAFDEPLSPELLDRLL